MVRDLRARRAARTEAGRRPVRQAVGRQAAEAHRPAAAGETLAVAEILAAAARAAAGKPCLNLRDISCIKITFTLIKRKNETLF